MTNVLNMAGKKFTFLELEVDAVFEEDGVDIMEVVEEDGKGGEPKENIVDDDAAAKVDRRGHSW
jgi:hypothetical protein